MNISRTETLVGDHIAHPYYRNECLITRDVVLRKNVLEPTQKIAISNQLQPYFEAKGEKGVGTFPRVPASLHPCLSLKTRNCYSWKYLKQMFDVIH